MGVLVVLLEAAAEEEGEEAARNEWSAAERTALGQGQRAWR